MINALHTLSCKPFSITRARAVAGIAALALLALPGVSVMHAQESPVPPSSVYLAPVMMTWSFKTPLVQDSLTIRGITQMAVPVSVLIPIGRHWAFDASGAYALGRVAVTGSDGVQHDLSLNGPSDVKLRLVGALAHERFRLTLGVNAPSGTTKLTGTQIDAIRVIGAPALRSPVPVLGSGLGATAGLVMAAQAGEWAVAFGTSYEMRGSYSPIEASIAGVASPTDLDPADAYHFTVGADRVAGAHRVSFLVSADIYGEDKISVTRAGGTPVEGSYKLGPSITAISMMAFGVHGFREFSISLLDRYRTAFRGSDGKTAQGSAGNFLDVNWRAVSGAPQHFGVLFGADAHFDSGQEVDNTIATAAVTSAGVMLGFSIPAGSYALQPYGRAQFGNLDTGLASTSMSGFSVGVAWTRR